MTSFNVPVTNSNKRAGADLSAESNLYKALVNDGNGDLIIAGANAASVGFLANSPKTGEATEFYTLGGGAKGRAGAVIAAGDLLATDANGDLVVATTGQFAVARADNSAVVGDIFAIQPIIAQLN